MMIIKNKTINNVIFSFAIIIVVGSLFVFNNVFAAYNWKAPTALPPDGNEPRPVNISSDFQAKQGGLTVSTDVVGDFLGLTVQNGNFNIGNGNIVFSNMAPLSGKGNIMLNMWGLLNLDHRIYFYGGAPGDANFLSLKAPDMVIGKNNLILPNKTGQPGNALMIESFNEADGNAVLKWGVPTEGVPSDGDWIFDNTDIYTTYFTRVGSDESKISIPFEQGSLYVQNRLEVDGDIWGRNPNKTDQKATFNHVDIYGNAKITGFTTPGIISNTDTGVLRSGLVSNGLTLSDGALKWGGSLTGTTSLNFGDNGLIYNLGNTSAFRINYNSDYVMAVMKNSVGAYSSFFGGSAYFEQPIYVSSGLFDSLNSQGQTGYVLKSTGSGVIWSALEDSSGGDSLWTYDSANNDIYSTYFARIGNGANIDDITRDPSNFYVEQDLEVDGDSFLKNIFSDGLSIAGFTTGSVIFQGTNGLTQDNDNFFWNNTNKRLGLGTTEPVANFHINNSTITNNAEIAIQSNAGTNNHWGIYNDRDTDELRFWKGDNRFVFTPGGDLSVGRNLSVTGKYYDSNNYAGITGYVLSSTGAGTQWSAINDLLEPDSDWQYGTANDIYSTYFTRVGNGGTIDNLANTEGNLYVWKDLEVDGDLFTKLSAGSVPFINTNGKLDQNNEKLFWDSTNNRLGVGTNAPEYGLDLRAVSGNAYLNLDSPTDATAGVKFGKGGVNNFSMYTGSGASADNFYLSGSANNVIMAATADGSSLMFNAPTTFTNTARFNTDASFFGKIFDNQGEPGSDGYLLQSTGTGVAWMDPSSLAAETYWQYENDNIYSTYFTRIGNGDTIDRITQDPGNFYVEKDLEVDGNSYLKNVFSDSLSISGFTTGSVIFQGPNGLAQDNSNFFWDNTNKRLGIGTATPTNNFHVIGDGRMTSGLFVGTGSGKISSPSTNNIDINSPGGNVALIGAMIQLRANTIYGYGGTGHNVLEMSMVGADISPVSVTGGQTPYDLTIGNRAVSKKIKFQGSNNGVLSRMMTMDPTVGIGIGTDSPGYGLDLLDNNSTAIMNINNAGALLYTGTRLARNNTEKWFVGMDNANDNLLFRRDGTYNDLYLDSAGDLFADNNLHVSGAYHDSNDSAGTNGYLLGSTGSGTTWVDSNSLKSETFWLYDSTNNDIYSTYFTRIGNGDTIDNITRDPGNFYVEKDLEVDGNSYLKDVFSDSLSISGFTTGSVIFQGTDRLAQDNDNFFWNNTNKRLGIGTSDPIANFHIYQTATGTNNAELAIQSNAGTNAHWGIYNDRDTDELRFWKNNGDKFVFTPGGDLSVGRNLSVTGKYYDSNNYAGITGYVLSSTESGTQWSDINDLIEPDSDWQYGTANDIYSTYFVKVGDYGTPNGITAPAPGDMFVSRNLEVDGDIFTKLTTGSVPFINTNGKLDQNNEQLFWDNTNKRLGIGTNTPTALLDIDGAREAGRINKVTTSGTKIEFNNSGDLNSFVKIGDMITIKYIVGGSTIYVKRKITKVDSASVTVDRTLPNVLAWAIADEDGNYSIGKTVTLRDNTLNFESNRINIYSKSLDSTNNPVIESFLHNFGNIDNASRLPSNTFLGLSAGNTTMIDNGWAVGEPIGGSNSGVGLKSLNALTTGYRNSGFGSYTLAKNTTGIENVAVGSYALSNNTIGKWNSAFGSQAMESLNSNNTTNNGHSNVAFGYKTLNSSTLGKGNTAIGTQSLEKNIIGNGNTAVGWAAGWNNTGSDNIFLGSGAGYSESGDSKLWINNYSQSSNFDAFIYGEMYRGAEQTNPQTNPFLRVNANLEIMRYNTVATSNGFNAELKIKSKNVADGHWGIYHQGIANDFNENSLMLWKKTSDATSFSANRFAFGETGNLSLFGNPYNPGSNSASNATGQLRFFESDDSGGNTNFVGFKAQKTLASNSIWTLPNNLGNNGQVMVNDGSGNLSWENKADDDWNWSRINRSLYTLVTEAGCEGTGCVREGNVGIGTDNPRQKLDVSGGLVAKEYYGDALGQQFQGLTAGGNICFVPKLGGEVSLWFVDGLLVCIRDVCGGTLYDCIAQQ